MEIKKALTGKGGSSKEEVMAALDKMFQNVPKKMLNALELAETKREHPYDSLGAIVACWHTDPMRMARQF